MISIVCLSSSPHCSTPDHIRWWVILRWYRQSWKRCTNCHVSHTCVVAYFILVNFGMQMSTHRDLVAAITLGISMRYAGHFQAFWQWNIVFRYSVPDTKEGAFEVKSMATTTIFYVSCFQYLMLAFALSKGPPFRKRIWTNGTSSVFTVFFFIAVIAFVLEHCSV